MKCQYCNVIYEPSVLLYDFHKRKECIKNKQKTLFETINERNK